MKKLYLSISACAALALVFSSCSSQNGQSASNTQNATGNSRLGTGQGRSAGTTGMTTTRGEMGGGNDTSSRAPTSTGR